MRDACLGCRSRFADDFDVGLGTQQFGEAAANDLVVIDQENTNRIDSLCPLSCG